MSLFTPGSLMSDKRYVFMDGLRGIAAILVMTRHTGPLWHLIYMRTYLAVDVFFIMSGFVIAAAYDHRILDGSLSWGAFMKVRLIRLYPILLFSLLLCLVPFYIACTEGPHAYGLTAFWQITALTFLLLPSHLTPLPEMFIMNAPQWSLFYELVINGLYAVARPLMRGKVLLMVIVALGLGLAAMTLKKGNLNAGFEWSLPSLIVGLTRSGFGIFTGLALYRYRDAILARIPRFLSPWHALLVLCGIMILPAGYAFDGIVDAIAVIAVMPVAIVILAKPATTRWAGALVALGASSYPLYLLHMPIYQLLLLPKNPQWQAFWTHSAPVSGLLFAAILVPLCILIERRADVPLRKWLSGRLLPRRTEAKPQPAQ